MNDWQDEMRRRITRAEELPPAFTLSAAERAFFDSPRPGTLKFAVTRYYCGLARPEDPRDPIRRQFLPRVEELEVRPYELADPLGEIPYGPAPRLIHRYRDRVLLLVTDRCGTYCRFCFRRRFASQRERAIGEEELEQAAAYVRSRPEVEEVILSGGDPLTLEDRRLEAILHAFRVARRGLVLRIHTRMPVVLPQRVTPELARTLAGLRPLWLVTQFNHPRELTAESGAALDLLAHAGLPLLNQSVLLKGVNDEAGTLSALFRGLQRAGVKPYYLFHPDLARGTAHFRPSLRRGIELVRRLGQELSGVARPVYALDLPGGGGKVALHEGQIGRVEDGWHLLEDERRRTFRYPVEEEAEDDPLPAGALPGAPPASS